MSQAFMLHLQTSLSRSAGMPACDVDLNRRHNLLYSISYGIQPSFIRVTCPSHGKCFWEIRACKLEMLPLPGMS